MPTVGSPVYCFGNFRFDSLRRLLFRGSDVSPLSERLALILTQLIQANGSIVNKEALAVSVWPDEAVSDANLTQHIYMLRRLLGERASDHAYILAVPRQGYRFALPVTVADPPLNESFTADAASLGEVLSGEGFEPFRNYCQGSFFLEQRTEPSLERAIEFFKAALESNPTYVPALIGLARAYSFLATYWHVPPALSFPLAKEAIEKALAIDSASAVAHAVRSGLLSFCDWNWRAAEKESAIAIRLNPGSTFARTNAAWVQICVGRYKDALAHAQFALMRDPSSLPLRLLLARVLLHSGDYVRAIAIISNVLEADRSFYIARRYRAQAYLLIGEPENAIADLELLPQDRGEDPSFRLPMLGRAYADLGYDTRAAGIFDALRAVAHSEYVVCWNLAMVASGLGRAQEALAYLEAACEQREPTLPFLKSLPWFKLISEDRRFRKLLRDVGPSTRSESIDAH
jgi:DNA-binding winged helix-turn-helix (wHTH) protein/Flp pilus assembly protein TadD